MNAVKRALEFYEQFDSADATKAWRELEEILENGTPRDGSVIVAIGGVKQPLIEEALIVYGDNEPIPVVVVERS